MTKIDKDIMEIYRSLCEVNDMIIKKEKTNFMPICALIGPEKTISIIGMVFKNGDEKEKAKQVILKHIANQNTKAYILIMDGKMTKVNEKTNEKEVSDVSMRSIYTPKESYMEMIVYKDGEILETIKQEDGMTFQSEWNLWGEHIDYDNPEIKKELDDYDKFKKENKDLYGNLA